jgi:hypothetical protein
MAFGSSSRAKPAASADIADDKFTANERIMHSIDTDASSTPQPSQRQIDIFAKKASDIQHQITSLVQAWAPHLKAAVRARDHGDELREKYHEYFTANGALKFMTTLLIGCILVGIYCLDIFLVRQPVEFLVGTFLGETASRIAVLIVPAAIMALEIWAGSRLHEAIDAYRRDEAGKGPVIEWAIIAGICALAVPTAIVVTYLASDLTGGLLLLIVFQLALALVAHLGVLAGAHIIMDHATWALIRFRHWRWTRRAVKEDREASQALAMAERKAMELRKVLDKAARYDIKLPPGALPLQVRTFLETHFPGEFDLTPIASHAATMTAPVIMLAPSSGQRGQGHGDYVPR